MLSSMSEWFSRKKDACINCYIILVTMCCICCQISLILEVSHLSALQKELFLLSLHPHLQGSQSPHLNSLTIFSNHPTSHPSGHIQVLLYWSFLQQQLSLFFKYLRVNLVSFQVDFKNVQFIRYFNCTNDHKGSLSCVLFVCFHCCAVMLEVWPTEPQNGHESNRHIYRQGPN